VFFDGKKGLGTLGVKKNLFYIAKKFQRRKKLFYSYKVAKIAMLPKNASWSFRG